MCDIVRQEGEAVFYSKELKMDDEKEYGEDLVDVRKDIVDLTNLFFDVKNGMIDDVINYKKMYEQSAKMKLNCIRIASGEKSIEFYPGLLEDFERDIVTRFTDIMINDNKTIGFGKE